MGDSLHEVVCPACRKRLQAEPAALEGTVTCPGCHQPVELLDLGEAGASDAPGDDLASTLASHDRIASDEVLQRAVDELSEKNRRLREKLAGSSGAGRERGRRPGHDLLVPLVAVGAIVLGLFGLAALYLVNRDAGPSDAKDERVATAPEEHRQSPPGETPASDDRPDPHPDAEAPSRPSATSADEPDGRPTPPPDAAPTREASPEPSSSTEAAPDRDRPRPDAARGGRAASSAGGSAAGAASGSPEPPLWTELDASVLPPARSGHAMVHDPARGVIVLFGGTDGDRTLDDTWTFDGTTWERVEAEDGPPARSDHAMAWDPENEKVLLFGGRNDGSRRADTWTFDGRRWEEASGPAPPARFGHAMARHEGRENVVLFGGFGSGGRLADTWEWNGWRWSERNPMESPPGRTHHAMAWEPSGRSVLLLGGSDGDGRRNDVWAWDGSAWSERSDGRRPPARDRHALAADPASGRLVVFGGWGEQGRLGDLWIHADPDWRAIGADEGPPARSATALATAPEGGLLLFGGDRVLDPLGDAWRGRPKLPPATSDATDPPEGPVADALDWLARHQDADGRWDADAFFESCDGSRCSGPSHHPDEGGPGSTGPGRGYEHFDVGVTGLALLAFLVEGQTPRSGDPAFRPVIERAIAFLVDAQATNGGIGFESDRTSTPENEGETIYNHAIATTALCKAYRRTRDPALRDPAESAVRFCLEARNPDHGWRYGIRSGDDDTSVTGWMVRALHAAREAGFSVPSDPFEGALDWFDRTTVGFDTSSGRFDPSMDRAGEVGYMQAGDGGSFLPPQEGRYVAVPTMTATAILGRVLAGQRPREPVVRAGAAILLGQLPRWGSEGSKSLVNLYYWYHGTHALNRLGRSARDRWNAALREALLPTQRRGGSEAGSWDPVGDWGIAGGRVYATAIAALTLSASSPASEEARADPETASPDEEGRAEATREARGRMFERQVERRANALYRDRRRLLCSRCDGRGIRTCGSCAGSGDRTVVTPGAGGGSRRETCSTCGGRGEVSCSPCRGGWRIDEAVDAAWEFLPPAARRAALTRHSSRDAFLAAALGNAGRRRARIDPREPSAHQVRALVGALGIDLRFGRVREVTVDESERTAICRATVRLPDGTNLRETTRWIRRDTEWYLVGIAP